LVSDIPAGDGKIENLFYSVCPKLWPLLTYSNNIASQTEKML
jgi:hypothetical protein